MVLNADFYFSPNQSANYFSYLESISAELPSNVAGIHLIIYNNFTNSVSQCPTIEFDGHIKVRSIHTYNCLIGSAPG